MRRALATFVAALAVGQATLRPAAGDGPAPTETERAFYAWWDGLGYPDLAVSTFVRFDDRGLSRSDPDVVSMGYEVGFLLSDDGATAAVLSTALRVVRFATRADPVPGRRPRAYEPYDLPTFVRRGLAEVSTSDPGTRTLAWRISGDFPYSLPRQASRLAVLARACAARGHLKEAHDLCELAIQAESKSSAPSGGGEDRVRLAFDRLRSGISGAAYTAFEIGLTDRRASWRVLANEARPLVHLMDPPWAQRWIAQLGSLAAAEEARAGGRSRAPRTLDERVADAIARLPDADFPYDWQDGRRSSDDGRPDAADELLEIGRPAVPRLIEAIDDARPTRVLLTILEANFSSTHPVSTGELARSILRSIAEDLGIAGDTGWEALSGAADLATKETLRAAWAKVPPRDEIEFSRRAVATESPTFGLHLRRLAATDPLLALAAASEGLDAALGPHVARRILDIIGDVPGPGALDVLRSRLSEDRPLGVRLMAARALLRRGSRDGIAPMARAWAGVRPDVDFAFDGHGAELLRFLARSGDEVAVRALSEGLARHDASLRHRVVGAFLPSADASGPAPGPGARDAIEDLLAGRLDDPGTLGGDGPRSVPPQGLDARVAHAAAQVLAARFPDRYAYDSDAPTRPRERMLAEVANAYRAARGLPARALPGPPPSLPSAGVGSLVTKIDFPLAGPAPDSSLRAKVEGLLGKPLTGAAFASILAHLVESDPPRGRGVRVRAERLEVGGGLVLTVTLFDRPAEVSRGWTVSGLDVRAGRWGHGASAPWAAERFWEFWDPWTEHVLHVDSALCEPSDVALHAEAEVVRH